MLLTQKKNKEKLNIQPFVGWSRESILLIDNLFIFIQCFCIDPKFQMRPQYLNMYK